MVAEMGLSGVARSLALNCQLVGRRDNTVRLALDPRFQATKTASIEAKLQQALSAYFGTPVRLEFVADNGEVLATEDLTIATASDLQDAVDKGYQAALGFAANAPNSVYCQ